MKVVIDTCVVIGHFHLQDANCSQALHALRRKGHQMVVCKKLLDEYRGILCRSNKQMYSVIDTILMTTLPIDLMVKYHDPKVRIEFGPPEDRFHMQLAIDSQASYHVSRDKGVLSEAKNMRKYNVEEVSPNEYLTH